ncbi:flotillin family protein [Ruminococcus flavefaciens]|uniref:flotillin family protein n=1 Tax=Ruminococcus flavefaciens TaxID=1265 RepID=UPI000467778E|nr:SPFH domain-containing protein [Ruminococcus flavefaciens]
MFDNMNWGVVIPAAIGIILLLVIIFTGYIKAPPDTAYIISGLRKKIIIGKASIRIPFFERVDKLKLQLIAVDVKTSSAVPTADYININVDANVNVKVSSDPQLIKLGAENFLNKDTAYVAKVAREVLEGNMREIVGQMSLEAMVNDRKAFAEKVQENAAPDLNRMGLEIVSFNVQNFTDDQNLIENLGIDNTTKIQKKAAIARAESEKEIEIAKAQAKKEANDAKILAETEIAQKNNELAIRQAELKKEADTQLAIADAAYEIQKEEQRKSIEVSKANANIAASEKDVELKAREAEVTEKALEAQIKKKAEADRYKAQQEADAKLYQLKKEAEADRFQREQEAEAQKAEAEAQKYAKMQEAEGIAAVGKAEADAIRAKGLAEAEGINAKAEAMKKYGEAAVLEMYFKALPEVVKNAATPLSQVDKITMYGEGNSSRLVGDIIGSTTKITDGLTEATGVDIRSLLAGFLGGKMAAPKAAPAAAQDSTDNGEYVYSYDENRDAQDYPDEDTQYYTDNNSDDNMPEI